MRDWSRVLGVGFLACGVKTGLLVWGYGVVALVSVMGFGILDACSQGFRGEPRTGNGSSNGGMELLKSQSGKPRARI